jgi:hypothetical protein
MVSPAIFAFALFFAQAARALPEPGQLPLTPGECPYSAPPSKLNVQPPVPLRATYDTTFDNPSGSMNGVACSNGVNGLASKFPTFGDLPSFSNIGGAYDITFNSPNCGACWSLTYNVTGNTINITAIDTAGAGFNIAKGAFERLTNGDTSKGAIDVTAEKISSSVCPHVHM